MKNLGTLYGYELKKLLKRPLSWAAVLSLAGFCAYVMISAGAAFVGISMPVPDGNGEPTEEFRTFSGEELYDLYARYAGKLNGRAVDDALFQEMLEQMPVLEGIGQEWYFLTEDYTWRQLYDLVRLSDIRTVTAEKFYAAQWEETQEYWEKCGLSEEEKAYWTEKASQIEKPWIYQAPWAGAGRAFSGVNLLLLFLPLAVTVSVCALFSEDRRTRAEPLVFTAAKSRACLYWAKILAGVTVTALAAAVLIGTVVVSLLCVWGVEGLGAPVQFYSTLLPRPITMGEMFLPIVLLLALFALVYGGLTILLSMAAHSSLVALGAPVVLSFVMYMAPAFSRDGGLGNYLRGNLMGYDGVHNLRLVNLFGVYLDNFQAGTLLYLAAALVLLALCWPLWRRSAENSGT